MRIIAGTARSIPLKTVKGRDTRPTTDRIKETLFNMIQPDIPGAVFLDLFAGCGGIGLEAVSRGADYAVFVDNSRQAVSCIEENIASAKFQSRCEVKRMDFLSAIKSLEGRFTFDLIFIDPPYGKGLAAQALDALAASSICAEDVMIIVEESLDFLPEELTGRGFEITRIKTYKTNQHIFLKKGVLTVSSEKNHEKSNLPGQL
ncbi:MAG: 16S rRNA (guanine(966)-N(2))-methyltransferase RsmD [Clostridiales bacterium]|nr:16S rRNA (guanine(966)-N(2))-methyltransferase RsmD [Clostridiales bacterium]